MAEISTTTYTPDEIRYAGIPESEYRADIVTVCPLEADLVPGTPMAYLSSGTYQGYYAKYVNAGSEGRDVCAGILKDYSDPVGDGVANIRAMYVGGSFILSKLTDQGLDDEAINHLNAKKIPGKDRLDF